MSKRTRSASPHEELAERIRVLEGRVDRRSDRETELTRRVTELELEQERKIMRLETRVLELERQENQPQLELNRLFTRFSLADATSIAPFHVFSEIRDMHYMVNRHEEFLLERYPEGEAGQAPQAIQAPKAPQAIQAPRAIQAQQRVQVRPPELVYENIPVEARPFAVWKNIAGRRLIFCISCNDGTCAYSTIGPFVRHCQSAYHNFFLEFDLPRVADMTGPLKEKCKQTFKWRTANWDEATEAYQQYTGANGSLAFD